MGEMSSKKKSCVGMDVWRRLCFESEVEFKKKQPKKKKKPKHNTKPFLRLLTINNHQDKDIFGEQDRIPQRMD